MSSFTPRLLEYHQYMQDIFGVQNPEPLFIATEKEFKQSKGIAFPYRSYFYAFGVLHEDKRNFRIGFRDFEMRKQSLTLVGPGILRLWLDDNWAVKNTTIFFTSALFQKSFNSGFLLDYSFFKPGSTHVLNLSDNQYQNIIYFFKLLNEHNTNQRITAGVLFALLEYIAEIYRELGTETDKGFDLHKVVQPFTELLYKHFQNHKDVGFYAYELNISTKHLSDILRKEVGKSAKQIIDDYIFMEAQALLKQTNLSVQEIVYRLGYDDPSYFSKQFKRKIGMSPSKYR